MNDDRNAAQKWLSDLRGEPEIHLQVPGVGHGDSDQMIGTIFADKYRILSELGRGGMSTVYRVENILLGSTMALKLMHKTSWGDQEALRRFRVEAQAVSKLVHPNLITFRDFGVTADLKPYLVMDYLSGTNLEQAVESENGISLPRALNVMEQLCRGLEVAHKAGVIHRDIKPANIMFLSDQDQELKLVDFGLAKIVSEDVNQSQQLTRTGDVFGSPLYMSPEQCLGRPIDHRTDIYSLGCVLYTAVTGEPPFLGQSILETLNKHVSEVPVPPSKLRPDLVSAVKAGWVNVSDFEYMVLKCLEKKAEDRYQSIGEILEDIQSIRKQVPLARTTITKSNNTSRLRTAEAALPTNRKETFEMLGAVLYTVIALTIVLTIGASWFLMPKSAPPPPAVATPHESKSPAAFNAFSTGKTEEESAVALDTQAYRYFVSGEYAKAIPLLKFGLEVYRKDAGLNPKNTILFAENLSHVGKCYFKTGDYLNACTYYKEALENFRKVPPYKGSLQRECLLDYASVLRELNQVKEAEKLEAEAKSLLTI